VTTASPPCVPQLHTTQLDRAANLPGVQLGNASQPGRPEPFVVYGEPPILADQHNTVRF